MSEHVVEWGVVEPSEDASGVVIRALRGEGASLVQVTVPAGTSAPRHDHPHEQFVQVLSGRGRIRTSQGERAFGAGSVFHFPAATWHEAVFDEETVLVETNLAS